VVPVLVGPLQVLVAILPGLLALIGGALLAALKPSAIKATAIFAWRVKLQLLGIAVVVAGAIVAGSLLWPTGAAVAVEASESDWPMFRGGPQRTGAAAGSPGPAAGGVVWQSRTKAKTFFSSPAVVGNMVYATSVSLSAFGQGSGAIWCLDADSGSVVWRHRPSGYRPTFSSPAVHVSNEGKRFLVVGEGLHVTTDARIICLDITDPTAVKLLWKFRTTSHVESSPCIQDGRVYVGAGDDGFYCFELPPDDNGQPQVVWHVPGDRFPDTEASPVVHDGKVYVALGVSGNGLCCLDAETGTQLWRVDTPYPVFTPPTIAGDRVFVGMGNGNVVESAEQVMQKHVRKIQAAGASESDIARAKARLAPAGEVWGIQLRNPADRWRFPVSRTVLGAVAATDDSVVFATRGGEVYRLTRDGRQKAKWEAHAPIVASPAVTDENVYVMTTGGTLVALARDDLSPVWEATAAALGDRPFMSSPAIARGHAYVGTETDGVVCLGQPQDADEAALWAGHLGGPQRAGRLDRSDLPVDDVTKLWPRTAPAAPPVVLAPAAATDGAFYVPVADGPRKGLACLTNPPEVRAPLTERWFYPTTKGVYQSPAANGRQVFVVDGRIGDVDRHVSCLDKQTGELLWQAAVDSDASGRLTLLEDAVCVQDGDEQVTCRDLNGHLRWQRRIGRLVAMPARQGAVLVAARDTSPSLIALDAGEGQALWAVDCDAAPTTGPAIVGKTVLVGTASGVEARSLLDGSLLWRNGTAGTVGLTVSRSTIAAITDTPELVVLSADSGRELYRSGDAPRSAQPSLSTPPMIVGDNVLYATDTLLMRVSVDGGQREPLMDISWLGRMTAPPVMVESRLYFATDRYGFVRVGQWR
jgi:outer membrane protein assembly factor BamB